jgi:DNA-binding MarR family transcriptional regulator
MLNSEARAKVDALTRLVLAIFRTNGALLAAGDVLVEPLGLSSARYQVLGAVALSAEPLTVPGIARAMGLTRQGVQKQVDLLVSQRLLVLRDNPEHRRSAHVRLAPAGRRAFASADRRWRRLAQRLVKAHPLAALERAGGLVESLGHALEEPHALAAHGRGDAARTRESSGGAP